MNSRAARVGIAILALCTNSLGQASPLSSLPQAELPVRRLYQQLVSRPIGGIPTVERMKSLSPYLSDSLLNRITQARACGNDWFRLHPQNDTKAPLAWLEFGLFSGAD